MLTLSSVANLQEGAPMHIAKSSKNRTKSRKFWYVDPPMFMSGWITLLLKILNTNTQALQTVEGDTTAID